MIGSWRWHTTGTSMILSMYWACGISTVFFSFWIVGDLSVCHYRHVHDLLGCPLLDSLLQRLDFLLSAAARTACVMPEFLQSGFSFSMKAKVSCGWCSNSTVRC